MCGKILEEAQATSDIHAKKYVDDKKIKAYVNNQTSLEIIESISRQLSELMVYFSELSKYKIESENFLNEASLRIFHMNYLEKNFGRLNNQFSGNSNDVVNDNYILKLCGVYTSDYTSEVKYESKKENFKDILGNFFKEMGSSLSRVQGQMCDDCKTLEISFIKNNHKLSEFGNDISIVFQNHTPICNNYKNNILFTGDFGKHHNKKSNWPLIEEIESTENSPLNMHSYYKAIKVPHHGTKMYYHKFDNGRIDDNTVLLIPNGETQRNWKIYQEYKADTHYQNNEIICSREDECVIPSCINCHRLKNGMSLTINLK